MRADQQQTPPPQQLGPIIVEVPGMGEVEFPAGTSENDMQAAIEKALSTVTASPSQQARGRGTNATNISSPENLAHFRKNVVPGVVGTAAAIGTEGGVLVPGLLAGLTSKVMGNENSQALIDAAANAVPGALGQMWEKGGNILRGVAARRLPTFRTVTSTEQIHPPTPGRPAGKILDPYGKPAIPEIEATPGVSARVSRRVEVPPMDRPHGDTVEALLNSSTAATIARQAYKQLPGRTLDRTGRAMIGQAPSLDALARALFQSFLQQQPR